MCLAGGCAMNSVANGKVRQRTPFTSVYIQPAAGDNGTALGAACYVWNETLQHDAAFVMEHAYWGTSHDVERVLASVPDRDNAWEYRYRAVSDERGGGARRRGTRRRAGTSSAGIRAAWSGVRARSETAASSPIRVAAMCVS